MAAYNKFNKFVEDLANKVHDLIGAPPDAIKIFLSNDTPVATDAVKADLSEIDDSDAGYTAGGASVTPVGSRTDGVVTLAGTAVVFTAADAGIGPFQQVVLYNDTPAAPLDPLIAWWDHGEPVTLAVDETFTVRFDNEPAQGTIFTLA